MRDGLLPGLLIALFALLALAGFRFIKPKR